MGDNLWVQGFGYIRLPPEVTDFFLKEVERKVKEVGCKLAQEVWRGARTVWDRWGFDAGRERLLKQLFGMPSLIWLQPAREHEYTPKPALGEGYPHDQHATNTIARLFSGAGEESSCRSGLATPEVVPATDSLACAGSPVSNSITAAYLPYWNGQSAQEPEKTVLNPARIPYHFYKSDAPAEIAVISGMRGGVKDLKRPHGIRRNYGNSAPWRPRRFKHQGWLHEDFVIVSRLPRSPDGGEVLLIAGAHGPGVQAFELMLDPKAFPLSALEKLVKHLDNNRYYQFVLEAYDIKHENSDEKMSVARKIRVSEECGLEIVEPAKDLFT